MRIHAFSEITQKFQTFDLSRESGGISSKIYFRSGNGAEAGKGTEGGGFGYLRQVTDRSRATSESDDRSISRDP